MAQLITPKITMSVLDSDAFPLVRLHPVAHSQNEWAALHVQADAALAFGQNVDALFGTADLLTAIAPLDCVLDVADPAQLTPDLLPLLPQQRVLLSIAAGAPAQYEHARLLAALHERGYRILLDGGLTPGMGRPVTPYGVALDCSAGAPAAGGLPARVCAHPIPHLALKVDSMARFTECERAGFTWFAGDYPLDTPRGVEAADVLSRRRVLGLLGLLARDADSYELELLLKQDPVLSYHLLKLVNSAAFAVNTQITGYAQAIARLGRRQLQRWLQLLLYARAAADGPPNLLLPLAALRAGQLELLCKLDGGDRDAQDLAFMTGAFSLLDRLLGMPMAEILADLRLPAHVESALLWREGELGRRLTMAERGAQRAQLAAAGIDARRWWSSQLHAYHWAIQVGRNV